jgi:hypothetical protein
MAANRGGEPLDTPSGTHNVRMHHGGAISILIAFSFSDFWDLDSEWGVGRGRGGVGAGMGTLLCRASEASEIALMAAPPLPYCSMFGARMICSRHNLGMSGVLLSRDPETGWEKRGTSGSDLIEGNPHLFDKEL